MTRPRQWTNPVSICPCESRKNSTYYHAISMKINMIVYIQKSHVNITWTQTVQSICVRLELSDILFVRLNPLELDMFLHSWMKPKYQYHSQWKTTPQTPFFRGPCRAGTWQAFQLFQPAPHQQSHSPRVCAPCDKGIVVFSKHAAIDLGFSWMCIHG